MLAIVAGIGALLVGAVVLILLVGDRPARAYPDGSPEAALQAYLVAWEAGDLSAAYAAFSADAQAKVPYGEYRTQAADHRRWNSGPDGPARRVFIGNVTIDGDRATLDLTIEETWVSGLTSSRNTYGLPLEMVRTAGAWRIDEILLGLEPGYFARF